jgi:hypothetical protein
MTIESIVERVYEGGNLLANLAMIDVTTWQTSQQVYKAWQEGAAIEGVNTANLPVYKIVDDEVVFNLLGHDGNLFVDERFREAVYNGILKKGYFMLEGNMNDYVVAAIEGGKSLETKYSKLNTETDGCSPSRCFIEACKDNTDEEKKLFKGVYGFENPGNGSKIYLFRENFVRAQLNEKPDDLIVGACFFRDSFNNDDRYLNHGSSAVRGVPLSQANTPTSIPK